MKNALGLLKFLRLYPVVLWPFGWLLFNFSIGIGRYIGFANKGNVLLVLANTDFHIGSELIRENSRNMKRWSQKQFFNVQKSQFKILKVSLQSYKYLRYENIFWKKCHTLYSLYISVSLSADMKISYWYFIGICR